MTLRFIVNTTKLKKVTVIGIICSLSDFEEMCDKGIGEGTFMNYKLNLKDILNRKLVRLLIEEAWLEIEIWEHQYTEIVIKIMGKYEITKR